MNQPEIEKQILEFWRKQDIFQKSLDKPAPKGEYVFYDGPPFATGTPHYGHIVASLMKDMVPRYFTMAGYRVARRWGWDCHGLPIENIVEEELGFKHKKEIIAYGIDKFNEKARSKVLKHADEWRVVIERLGRWVDMSLPGRQGPALGGDRDYNHGAYLTMDAEYMESVWWVFKQLWDKGLIYEGFRSMHICPRCETTLSQSEVSEGYKEVDDLSVVVKFRAKSQGSRVEELPKDASIYLLAWTTTPWTLPGNAALAVAEDIEYAVIKTTKKAASGLSGRRTAESNRIPGNEDPLGISQGPAPAGDILPILRRAYYSIKNNLSRGEGVLDPVWDVVSWLIPVKWQYSMRDFFVNGCCGKIFTFSPATLAMFNAKTAPGGAVFGANHRSGGSTSQQIVDAGIIAQYQFFDKEQEAGAGKYEYLVIAKKIFEKWREEGKIAGEIVAVVNGRDLVGLEYEPLFPYYDNNQVENRDNAFKVYAADFVNTEEGTGIVHIAPAFGEDDRRLGEEKNLPFIQHINMDGTLAFGENNQTPNTKHQENTNNQNSNFKFEDILRELNGLEVRPKDDPAGTDKKIVAYLDKRGLLFSQELYRHSYPHCWRCESPLLNYSTSSYFVAVTKIKEQLLSQAEDIRWVPAHIKEGRFGNWLANARDWSISRQRFWGSVIPIWKCENSEHVVVIGSAAELEKLSGKKIKDLHKHFVDKITFKCEKCGGVMRRIPDVLDCWFESGSMPYAQAHYPFNYSRHSERSEAESRNLGANPKGLSFPAQFIAEGVDQTRAWFYYLHLLGVALFGKAAFQNVVVNGIVLAEDGQKMSKRLANYPDPSYVFDKYGADAVRYYLAASPVMRAEDLNFSEKGVEEVVKKVLLPLYNVLAFYKLYAPSVSLPAPRHDDGAHDLDRWILAKTEELTKDITDAYEKYDMNRATRPIAAFINELSTWYLRRSRDRIKYTHDLNDYEAITTLRFVLERLTLLAAPVMPFTAEYVWQELGNKESVHLQDWPKAGKIDVDVLKNMDYTRKIVELGLAARAQAGIKIRQPLASVTITGNKLDSDYEALIMDELNVWEVKYKTGDELKVVFDTKLTDKLRVHGNLRELIRTINGQRKKAGLTVGDKIILTYQTDSEALKKVFVQYDETLKKAMIAEKIIEGENNGEGVEINGEKIKFSIQ